MRAQLLLAQQLGMEGHSGGTGEGAGCAGPIRPRAASTAMRAVTPLPVALRSIWPSPNTQKWRWRGAAGTVLGQDGAVEEGEVGLGRVADLAAGADHAMTASAAAQAARPAT